MGDSPYSHASVFAGEHIIEAGVRGVVTTELKATMSEAAGYEFMDVYRWADSGDAPYLPVVIDRARHYHDKRTEYGFQGLRLVVIAVAVRRKVFSGVRERAVVKLLRWIVERFIPDNPDEVVCSELVYRSFDEADTAPPHRMRPRIVIQGPSDRVWDIDISVLMEEIDLLKRAMDSDTDSSGFDATEVDDVEIARLEQRLAAIRERLDRDDATMLDPDVAGVFVPNPQAVIPLDFATSPSFTKVGRLAMP